MSPGAPIGPPPPAAAQTRWQRWNAFRKAILSFDVVRNYTDNIRGEPNARKRADIAYAGLCAAAGLASAIVSIIGVVNDIWGDPKSAANIQTIVHFTTIASNGITPQPGGGTAALVLECRSSSFDWLIQPFEDAEIDTLQKLEKPGLGFEDRVSEIREDILKHASQDKPVAGLLLIGSADHRPLTRKAKARGFESNAHLALARAKWVEYRLSRSWPGHFPAAMAISRGPDFADGSTPSTLAMPDRSVQVCVLQAGADGKTAGR